MTVANKLRSVIDLTRSIPAQLGFRENSVTLRVIQWSGRPGAPGSTSTTTDTPLLVNGTANPPVRQLSQKDLVASGGELQKQQLEITLTRPYSDGARSGGYESTLFDPALPTTGTKEVYFLISGIGQPAGGGWFRKVSQRLDGELSYKITIESIGAKAP